MGALVACECEATPVVEIPLSRSSRAHCVRFRSVSSTPSLDSLSNCRLRRDRHALILCLMPPTSIPFAAVTLMPFPLWLPLALAVHRRRLHLHFAPALIEGSSVAAHQLPLLSAPPLHYWRWSYLGPARRPSVEHFVVE